jgi:hypothetical protein
LLSIGAGECIFLRNFVPAPEVQSSIFRKPKGFGLAYFEAFKIIRNGVLLCNSIDDFLNIHEGSPAVVTVGKAAIVRTILHAERHSKFYVDPSNIYNRLDLVNI